MPTNKRPSRAAYRREWRERNLEAQREKDRAKQRRLRGQNPEHYRQYKREWREKNRERLQEHLSLER